MKVREFTEEGNQQFILLYQQIKQSVLNNNKSIEIGIVIKAFCILRLGRYLEGDPNEYRRIRRFERSQRTQILTQPTKSYVIVSTMQTSIFITCDSSRLDTLNQC